MGWFAFVGRLPHGVPARIWGIVAITSVSLVLLLVALVIGVQSVQQDLRELGRDVGPRLTTIESLSKGPPSDAQRLQVTRALVWAFETADGDPGLQQQVQEVLDGLSQYFHGSVNAQQLQDQAKALVGEYRSWLDKDHVRIQRDLSAIRVVIGVSGLFALACLLWLQIYLAKRYRRILNPALVVAIGVTAMYTVTGLTVLGTESGRLGSVIHALNAEDHGAFAQALALGQKSIAGLSFLLPTAIVAIVIFVLAGVGPRLREFR